MQVNMCIPCVVRNEYNRKLNITTEVIMSQ